jgi:hypothetical protein
MCPMLRCPILQSVLRPFWRSQQRMLAVVIAAVTERAQASCLSLAGHLAGELGT